MAKMIQLRHVPDRVNRTLKARAAKKGMSLSDYWVREVTQLAETPTIDEFLVRLRKDKPVKLSEAAAVTVRRLRGNP